MWQIVSLSLTVSHVNLFPNTMDGMQTPLSLTERRKLATQLEIARTAARLFAERGVSRVTVEMIAAEAGVSVRTFYRYFPAKQDAVAPLLSVGAARWRAAIEQHDEGDLKRSIGAAVVEVLTPMNEQTQSELDEVWGLLRATSNDRALASVWHRVNGEAEEQLVRVLKEQSHETAPLFSVRLLAAAATDAIRVGLEHWASCEQDAEHPAALAKTAFEQLSHGIK